jgi:hypothetical protein
VYPASLPCASPASSTGLAHGTEAPKAGTARGIWGGAAFRPQGWDRMAQFGALRELSAWSNGCLRARSPSRARSLPVRCGQPIEKLDYDGLALRGETVEVLPVGVSAEGVH